MSRQRRAVGAAVAIAALAAVAAVAACTQPPTGSLSVTPGPNATASLVPAEEGTPVLSGGASDQDGSSGPPVDSPRDGSASDVPAAS